MSFEHQNKLIPTEEAVEHLKKLCPKTISCTGKDFRLIDVDKAKLNVQVLGETLTIPYTEGLKFKKATGLDTMMLGRLSERVRGMAFEDLVSRVGDVTLKTRDSVILGISEEGGTVEGLNYPEWIERVVQKVQPIGISNIVVQSDQVHFGLVREYGKEPKSTGGHKQINDLVHSGVMVTMNGHVSARPYSLRQVCTNGLTVAKKGGETIIAENNFSALMDVVLKDSETFLDSFLHLAERPVADTGALVGRLVHERALNGQQIGQVTQQLGTLQNPTEYDVINLITQFQHTRANDLSWLEAGGRAVQYLHHETCPQCFSHM